MTDYFNQVAAALGLPRPPQITRAEAERQLSPGMLSYLAESKRLDVMRMRQVLGVEPRYPFLPQGLGACLTVDPGAWMS
jgi:nucleoside-diphosphate-sugar epimerase